MNQACRGQEACIERFFQLRGLEVQKVCRIPGINLHPRINGRRGVWFLCKGKAGIGYQKAIISD